MKWKIWSLVRHTDALQTEPPERVGKALFTIMNFQQHDNNFFKTSFFIWISFNFLHWKFAWNRIREPRLNSFVKLINSCLNLHIQIFKFFGTFPWALCSSTLNMEKKKKKVTRKKPVLKVSVHGFFNTY